MVKLSEAKDVETMNFTRIEYFLAAAKYLNFTKAANVLYISQPSLSKQIALLEDELGLPLFDRSARALQLTSAGKQLCHEYTRLMPEIDAISEKVKRMKTSQRDTFFIGCVESIYLGKAAAKMVSGFSSHAGDVDTFIERHGFETLHSKLMDGSIDVAFTLSTQIEKMKDIVCVDIERRSRCIIMSSDHKLANKDEIEIEDLRDQTFVILGKPDFTNLCDDIIAACESAGFTPKTFFAPNVDTILDYIELTGCIAFFDKSIVENRLGRLKHYPTKMEKRFNLVCIWKNSNRNPALHKFIQYLPSSQSPVEKK